MSFPSSILKTFADAGAAIRRSPWHDKNWSSCSGLWKPERYGDTVLLRTTKRNWSSTFPITVTEGGEIQYAAWVDEKLHRASTVRFEMHVFAFPTKKKIKKGDFTDSFRKKNRAAIKAFGFHNTQRGPAIPYAGSYTYNDMGDLSAFLVKDFSNFASLAGSIDRQLQALIK